MQKASADVNLLAAVHSALSGGPAECYVLGRSPEVCLVPLQRHSPVCAALHGSALSHAQHGRMRLVCKQAAAEPESLWLLHPDKRMDSFPVA